MPTEEQLAREFRTSRTTISKALGPLQEAGIIEQAPRRGTRVRPVAERPPTQAIHLLYARGVTDKPEGARIAAGAQAALARLNQRCEVRPIESPRELRAEALIGHCAGALFIEELGAVDLLNRLEEARFPYAVANLEQDLPFTSTWVDHGKTTRTAVRLLAALGHRRIALLMRPPEIFFYRRALAGFRAAIEETGLPLDEGMILVNPANDSARAFQLTRDLLQSGRRPTAIVAARDYLAAGACAALDDAGLTVGRDVSVIGFDDLTWTHHPPFLTTFREPTAQLGAAAAEMLVERLISGWRPAEKREIEAPLVLRRSVGLCPEPVAGTMPDILLQCHPGVP